jgi:hypothetical protein
VDVIILINIIIIVLMMNAVVSHVLQDLKDLKDHPVLLDHKVFLVPEDLLVLTDPKHLISPVVLTP